MSERAPLHELARQMAADVGRSLALRPRQIPSKYLYDALGSHLFEAICELPWYRITRAETALLRRDAAAMVALLGGPLTLIELGCGSGEKISIVAEAIGARGDRVDIRLVDISPTALELSERCLARFEHVRVASHRATYLEGLTTAAADRPGSGAMLVLFLGSNIGNFAGSEAVDMLRGIRATMRAGDGLLLGADLVKPRADLLIAYDDPLGVTAAFNKNLLVRMNRELGATFDLGAFVHRAVWNEGHSRIEMHLVSPTPQRVTIGAADLELVLDAGEAIWTESSYKYTPSGVIEMARAAGFSCRDQWIDAEARFSISMLTV